MDFTESTWPLADFSKSLPKSRGAAVRNKSGSSTRGCRSLFQNATTRLCLYVEMWLWALPRNRSAWVAASVEVSGVRRPAWFISRRLASGPTASRIMTWRRQRVLSASLPSFGIWVRMVLSSFGHFVMSEAGIP